MSIYDDYLKLVRKKDELSAKLENLKDEIKAAEELVLSKMAEEGLNKVSTDKANMRVSRIVRASAGFNMPRLVEAMRRAGMEEMVGETVNGSKLGGWVREQFDPNNELSVDEIVAKMPPDLREAIKVTETIDIKVTAKQW